MLFTAIADNIPRRCNWKCGQDNTISNISKKFLLGKCRYFAPKHARKSHCFIFIYLFIYLLRKLQVFWTKKCAEKNAGFYLRENYSYFRQKNWGEIADFIFQEKYRYFILKYTENLQLFFTFRKTAIYLVRNTCSFF